MEYRGEEERFKILQNRKMFYRPPRPDVALSGMVGDTESRLRKERSRMRARWNSGGGSSGSRVLLGKLQFK